MGSTTLRYEKSLLSAIATDIAYGGDNKINSREQIGYVTCRLWYGHCQSFKSRDQFEAMDISNYLLDFERQFMQHFSIPFEVVKKDLLELYNDIHQSCEL